MLSWAMLLAGLITYIPGILYGIRQFVSELHEEEKQRHRRQKTIIAALLEAPHNYSTLR